MIATLSEKSNPTALAWEYLLIKICFSDADAVITAKIIGEDPDVALEAINVNAKGLKRLFAHNNDPLRVGELAVAIASPLDEDPARVATPEIPGANGHARLVGSEGFIQAEAAINPGDSGVPSARINGDLAAVNGQSGGADGIRDASPLNLAQKALARLFSSGVATRGYLGVSIRAVPETIAKRLNLKSAHGVIVDTVVSGGPAEKAGLKTGDVILEFNNKETAGSAVQLCKNIASLSPGREVDMEILRDGARGTLKARIEPIPDNPDAMPEPQREQTTTTGLQHENGGILGFSSASLNPQIAERFHLTPNAAKVVVTDVQPSGTAAMTGLRPGDVIESVDNTPVTSYSQFNSLTQKKKSGDLLLLFIDRKGRKIGGLFSTIPVAMP